MKNMLCCMFSCWRGGAGWTQKTRLYGACFIFSGCREEVVRATAVGRDTVLAGDPKLIRLLCNSNLNISMPSRESEEKRIRICLQAWSNILVMDIGK